MAIRWTILPAGIDGKFNNGFVGPIVLLAWIGFFYVRNTKQKYLDRFNPSSRLCLSLPPLVLCAIAMLLPAWKVTRWVTLLPQMAFAVAIGFWTHTQQDIAGSQYSTGQRTVNYVVSFLCWLSSLHIAIEHAPNFVPWWLIFYLLATSPYIGYKLAKWLLHFLNEEDNARVVATRMSQLMIGFAGVLGFVAVLFVVHLLNSLRPLVADCATRYGNQVAIVFVSGMVLLPLLAVIYLRGHSFALGVTHIFTYFINFLALDWSCDFVNPVQGSQTLAWRYALWLLGLLPALMFAPGVGTVVSWMDADLLLNCVCFLCGTLVVSLPCCKLQRPMKGTALKDICHVCSDYLNLVPVFARMLGHSRYNVQLMVVWPLWVWFVSVGGVLDIYIHTLKDNSSTLSEADEKNLKGMQGQDKNHWDKLKTRAQFSAITCQFLIVLWWNSPAATFNFLMKIATADMVIASLNASDNVLPPPITQCFVSAKQKCGPVLGSITQCCASAKLFCDCSQRARIDRALLKVIGPAPPKMQKVVQNIHSLNEDQKTELLEYMQSSSWFPKAECGGTWIKNNAAPEPCQECQKMVNNFADGALCSNGGHRICWKPCLFKSVEWNKMKDTDVDKVLAIVNQHTSIEPAPTLEPPHPLD